MRLKKIIKNGFFLFELQEYTGSHLDKIISTVGGFVGIIAVLLVSHEFLGANGSSMIIASMGASSVLLFAAPHGTLSQPWAVLGGHTISAVVGVSCGLLIANQYYAAAIAVGISIGCMHYLRCLHPPGGATALVAVIGGNEVQSLGYQFVVEPVLINASVLVVVAIIINFPFAARRYPLTLKRVVDKKKGSKSK